jgi:transcription antitermination protein NusB
MGQRRKARELAFQLMYSHEQSGKSFHEISSGVKASPCLDENNRKFAAELLRHTLENLDRIDKLIEGCSLNWKIGRILPTDRNIMRVAVNEFIAETAPPAVIINEAIEISKKFGTSGSGTFVNGILDCIRKKLQAEDA